MGSLRGGANVPFVRGGLTEAREPWRATAGLGLKCPQLLQMYSIPRPVIRRCVQTQMTWQTYVWYQKRSLSRAHCA
jgi:hypothetical protein